MANISRDERFRRGLHILRDGHWHETEETSKGLRANTAFDLRARGWALMVGSQAKITEAGLAKLQELTR